MVAFLPGLFLAIVCLGLLIYAFLAHERHWALGFLGWRKVYAGLALAFAGAATWTFSLWLSSTAQPSTISSWLPLIAGLAFAAGLTLVLGGSIERLRDLAEERRRLEELRTGFDLYDVLREVVSGPYTFLEVLEFALKEMVRASDVTTGGLWLYNAAGREWVLTGAANMSQNFRRQVETVRGTGTGFDRLARQYKAHVFSRPDEIRLFFPEWEPEGLRSVLGLPLVTGTPGSSERRLLGVIILADQSESRFDDDRARRLHAAADYVAAVIAEGRLQRQLEAQNQQIDGLKASSEKEVEGLQEEISRTELRVAAERRAWEDELTSVSARHRAEMEGVKQGANSRETAFYREMEDLKSRFTSEQELRRTEYEAEVARIMATTAADLSATRHQVDVAVARLEELRRATDEEKRRMAEEAQARISAERARHDQALAQIRASEAAQAELTAQLEESVKSHAAEREGWDRKIEALETQHARERQALTAEHQRARESLQQRISEAEMLSAAIEQEHDRQMAELRTHVEDERRTAVDETRVLKQEFQTLRMSFADAQAQFAAERDALQSEARQVESRSAQLLEAERETHQRTRDDWEATRVATEQLLLDLKLELENTRFEQGMALARAHNETERVREEYEGRLTSALDRIETMEAELEIEQEKDSSDSDNESIIVLASDESQSSSPKSLTRELHAALLDWVSQQEQDEWHLELAAHDAPHVEPAWLTQRLDEARTTCRMSGGEEAIGFSIYSESIEGRTTLRMTRLPAIGPVDPVDPIGEAGTVARWLYSHDDRVGMEISFGSATAMEEAASEREPNPEEINEEALSVLVVEDQPEMQEVVTGMLASLGYQPSVATTAQEAYARYVAEGFDVVLISSELPQEESLTLTQWIKSHRHDVPVVLVCDSSRNEPAEPVDHVLVKPFAIEQLHECLLSLTEHARPMSASQVPAELEQ